MYQRHQKKISWAALTICQPNPFIEQKPGTSIIRSKDLPSQYGNNKTETDVFID